MLSAANWGDIAALKQLNSGGWAILAIIFSRPVQRLLLLGPA
jgi:hypothetical protein